MKIIKKTISNKNYSSKRTNKIGFVLHWIVGELSFADSQFANPNSRVSAHYGIGSNGLIHQYLDPNLVAWHAGNSTANANYIGIEHAGGQLINGVRKKPTLECHNSSVELITSLCRIYKISKLEYKKNIFKHSDIVPTQCCGSLDVQYIIQKVNNNLNNNMSEKLNKAIKDRDLTIAQLKTEKKQIENDFRVLSNTLNKEIEIKKDAIRKQSAELIELRSQISKNQKEKAELISQLETLGSYIETSNQKLENMDSLQQTAESIADQNKELEKKVIQLEGLLKDKETKLEDTQEALLISNESFDKDKWVLGIIKFLTRQLQNTTAPAIVAVIIAVLEFVGVDTGDMLSTLTPLAYVVLSVGREITKGVNKAK